MNNPTPVTSASTTTSQPSAPGSTQPAPKGSNVQPNTSTPVAKEASKTETKQAAKYKVTVDGAEQFVPLEELISGYGHHKAAEQRFLQAAETRKAATAILEQLKSDPISVMKKIGVDVDTFLSQQLQSRLKSQMEDLALTPEQKEQRKMQQELERYRNQENEQKQRQDQEKAQEKHNHAVAAISTLINNVLKQNNIPETKDNIRTIIEHLKRINATDDDVIMGKVDLNRIARSIKQQAQEQFKHVTNEFNPELLADMFDDGTLERFVQAYAKRKGTKLKPKTNSGLDLTPEQQARYDKMSPAQKTLFQLNNIVKAVNKGQL